MSVPLRSTKSGDAFDHDMKMQKVSQIAFSYHLALICLDNATSLGNFSDTSFTLLSVVVITNTDKA